MRRSGRAARRACADRRLRGLLEIMYAALGATNEAILRAKSEAELYQRVCDAAVTQGGFATAAAFVAEPATARAVLVASSGCDDPIRAARVSTDPAVPEGRGLVGTALRTGKPAVSRDLLHDERLRPWHDLVRNAGLMAAAALPLRRGDHTLGVLYFCSREPGAFEDEFVRVLERVADNIVFALNNFAREAERAAAEQAVRASEEKYRAILENMSEGYFEVDLAGNYTFFNEAMCRIHRASREQLLGMNYRAYAVDEETAKRVYAIYNEIYRTGKPAHLTEWSFLRADGTRGYWESSVQLMRDPSGKPIGFRGIVRDATERKQAEEALRASEEKYRGILETMSDGYFEVDLAGNYTFVNDATCRSHGRTREELIGLNYRAYMDPDTARRIYEIYNRIYRTGEPAELMDFTVIRKDGSLGVSEASVQLNYDQDGKPIGFRGVSRDVTSRRAAEAALRESEARFRALTELSSDWYWEQDEEFRFTRLDSRREDLVASRGYLLGRRPWETEYTPEQGSWDAHMADLAARKAYRDLVLVRPMPDGSRRYLNVSGEPFFDATGRFLGYRGVSREITDHKRAEERIQYLATHDDLTGLPNRVMFAQLLQVATESARRYGRGIAVLFVDLDRFKVINDTLGHDAGDKLLREIAARLRRTLRASDVVARLGGDEFVVLVQEVTEPGQAATIARKVLATVMQPVTLAGQECRVTASIGISLYPADAADQQALMKNADIAMYVAKEEGKNNFQFYSKEIKTQSLERLMLEAALRQALERDEFALEFQAKLDLRTQRLSGAEALLRWNSRELGPVSPAQFIPVAEETGLIVAIGKWVLRTACAQNVAWQRRGLMPVRMAVNLSARQFSDEQLLDDIAAILRETGMAPELLELEITEGMVIHNPERTGRLLNAIKQMGIRLAIDDFGTGYSSLGQLKNFPIDTLKVDRSFIRDIPRDPEDAAITRAIIAMGKALDLTVVAEGVETQAQVEFLHQHGCDEIQGYYFSRPMDADRFAELLCGHTAAAAPRRRSAL